MSKKVIIIGGGAAGMLAAAILAEHGAHTTIIEKNEKLGKKLYITGKGRCNLMNYCEDNEFFNSVVTNSKFLLSAYNNFNAIDIYNYFTQLGLKLKIERGNRVFPDSDKSSDVISTLSTHLKALNVDIMLNTGIKKINIDDNNVICGVTTSSLEYIACDKLIIATGGLSYPTTGSTGDGFKLANELGHTIVKPTPSLCGLILDNYQHNNLSGLTLKNVELKIKNKDNIIFKDTGELLFTHKGISGPIVLTASAYINKDLNKIKLTASIDLKPYIDSEELDRRIIKAFMEVLNKDLRNSLNELMPKSLIPIVIERSGVSAYVKVNSITKADRLNIGLSIKNIDFPILSLEDISSAVITSGGVSVKEINPKTMESKIIKNLYFAGEIIDVDALTGGFNLMIAFITARAAAIAATEDK